MIAVSILFFPQLFFAQLPVLNGKSETNSGMIYYDYKVAEDLRDRIYRYTICPDSAGCISLDFNHIEGDVPSDYIRIFAGNTVSSPLIHNLGKTESSILVQSPTKCITLEFQRDKASAKTIWTATWKGRSESACIQPMNENPCLEVQDICGPEYHENFPIYGEKGTSAAELPQVSCLTQPHNPSWYRFVAQKSGELKFSIKPDNGMDDFDWVLMRANPDNAMACPKKPETVENLACNYSSGRGPAGTTGMGEWGETLRSGSSESPFSCSISANKGDIFFLLVDDFSQHSSGFTIHFNEIVMPCNNPKKDLLQINWSTHTNTRLHDPRTTFSKYTQILRIDLSEKANQPIAENPIPTTIFSKQNAKPFSNQRELENEIGIAGALLLALKSGNILAYDCKDLISPIHYGDLLLLANRQNPDFSREPNSWWFPKAETMNNYHQVIELIVDEIFDKNSGRKRQEIRYIRLIWTDRDEIAPDFNAAVFRYEEVRDLLDQIPIENRHNDIQSLSIADFLEGKYYQGNAVKRSNKQIQNLQQAKFSNDQQYELENYIWGY